MQMVLTFDGALTIATGAFCGRQIRDGGGSVTTAYTVVVNGASQTVVTLSFSGGFTRGASGALTSDGYYRLTVDGTKIMRGGQMLDANGDGVGGDLYTMGRS